MRLVVDMADQVITFTQEGEFAAYNAAEKWCEENGYSCGSMQRDAPIGLLKGNWQIAKWRNLNADEIKQLDGTMSCINSFREAPVRIVLKSEGAR